MMTRFANSLPPSQGGSVPKGRRGVGNAGVSDPPSRLRRTPPSWRGERVLAAALAMTLAAGAARAELRQFSYDPADGDTQAAAGPVTLLISQSVLGGSRVLRMSSTEAKATAELRRADLGALGPDGWRLATDGVERDLYRILPSDEGAAFTAALCPGSKRAWLALTPVKYGRNVRAIVVGDNPAGGGVRRCRVLAFEFHGEWRLPAGASPPTEPNEPPDFPN